MQKIDILDDFASMVENVELEPNGRCEHAESNVRLV